MAHALGLQAGPVVARHEFTLPGLDARANLRIAFASDFHAGPLTDPRLLQRAIRAKTVPSFAELTGADAGRFYDEGRGTNYAQARYLLYYLQERGLLVRFYRQARAAKSHDPSGYATLQAVLGERDMAAFQARWEAWVLRLRFPE